MIKLHLMEEFAIADNTIDDLELRALWIAALSDVYIR